MSARRIVRILPLYLGVAATGLVALASIPLMISASGLEQWSDIGVGQAVGGLCAAVISYGWAITGPAEIARGSKGERRREYLESLKVRAAIVLPVVFLGAALSLTVTGFPGFPAAVAGVLSTALAGLSAYFYFIGTGELWRFLVLDSIPRAGGTLVGMVVVSSAPEVGAIAVPVGTAVGALVAVGLSTLAIARSLWGADSLPRQKVFTLLASKRHGLASSFSTGLLQIFPTLVVGWVAPAALGAFVFYDRIHKQGMTFLSPALNVFQGWVPRGDPSGVSSRMSRALLASGASAILCLLAVLFFGSALVDILSAGEVENTFDPLLALGLLIALSAVDLVLGRVGLVIKGRLRALAWSSVVSVIVSVALIAALAPAVGVTGALWGCVAGVLVRVGYSAVVFFRSPYK